MIPPAPGEARLSVIVQAVRQLIAGRSNAAGRVTLAPAATSTVVTSLAISPASCPQISPASAAAAAAGASTYVSAVADGSFTITHPAAAGTEVWHWHAVGG